MELGNMLFGNSRGKYQFPDRGIVNSAEWNMLLTRSCCDTYGLCENPKFENNYGGFSNEIFDINPYYWGECDCGADYGEDKNEQHKDFCSLSRHNFVYKPTGFSIDWYKYPFRDSYMSHELSKKEILIIFYNCLDSI